LKLFVLALAIVDDIGAIVVIAVFYSNDIHLDALAIALGLFVGVGVARLVGIQAVWFYVLLGALMWLAMFESGVHTTLVGVMLGLMAPTQPARQRHLIDEQSLLDLSSAPAAHQTAVLARESVSVVEWLEHLLHPWTSFVILPLFALANAGVAISAASLRAAGSSTVAWGVLLGLVLGKTIGITAFTWISHRLRIGTLPSGSDWGSIFGVAVLCGIGFTVSIFVSGLAFDDVATRNIAKIGILAASLVAAGGGSTILAVRSRRAR